MGSANDCRAPRNIWTPSRRARGSASTRSGTTGMSWPGPFWTNTWCSIRKQAACEASVARRSEIWLGDVVAAVHALTPDDEAIAELVRMCGLSAAAAWPETVQQEPPPRPDIQPPVGTPPAAAPETLRRERVEPSVSPPIRIFSTLTRIGSMPTTPQAPAWVQSVEPLAPSAAPTPRKPRPLFSHLHRRSIISYALATTVNEGALDVREIVRRIGRG